MPDAYTAYIDDMYHLPKHAGPNYEVEKVVKQYAEATKVYEAAVKHCENAVKRYAPMPHDPPTIRDSLKTLKDALNPIGEVCTIAALEQVSKCLEEMAERVTLLEEKRDQKVAAQDHVFKYPIGWLCKYVGPISGVYTVVARFLGRHEERKYVIEFRELNELYYVTNEDQLISL